MIRKMLSSVLAVLAAVMLINSTTLAGPPLICHTYEIGAAKSLPWRNATDWRAVKTDYDLQRLVNDTLALLTPETPVIVRMETMRRASIYAVWAMRDREVGYAVGNQKVADELLARLQARADKNKTDAAAAFDVGYLIESYRQAGWRSAKDVTAPGNGYPLVAQAATRSGDAAMEFAAALMTQFPTQPAHDGHLQKAYAGAAKDALLLRNLEQRFGKRMAKR